MNFLLCLTFLGGAWTASGGITVQRAGWLDRVVHYYKQKFVEDVQRVAPVQIQASIEPRPPGYVDTAPWDFESVSRLLALLGASESAAPVRRALRLALRSDLPTRRFISKQQSWKLFPSLGKGHPNEIYYDFHDYDLGDEVVQENANTWDENAVLVLQNPVEARLPGRQISVGLLKEILQARALAARSMPSTVRYTIEWNPMNKTETSTDRTPGADDGITTKADTDNGAADNADNTGGATTTGVQDEAALDNKPDAIDDPEKATADGDSPDDGAPEAPLQKLYKKKEKKNKPRLRPGDDSPPPILRENDHKEVNMKIVQKTVPRVVRKSVKRTA